MSSGVAIAVQVTLAIFAAGVVYQAGRLSARVDSLEKWREEMTRELSAIHGALRDLATLIRNGTA